MSKLVIRKSEPVYIRAGYTLTLIFLTLKLAALGVVAAWSWWLVFLPLIIQFPLNLLLAAAQD